MARPQKTWLQSIFDQFFMGGTLFLVFYAISELFVRFNAQIIWDQWTGWILARDVIYPLVFGVLAVRKSGNPVLFYKSALVIFLVVTALALVGDQRIFFLYAAPMTVLAAIIVYLNRRSNGIAGPKSGGGDAAPRSPFPYRR